MSKQSSAFDYQSNDDNIKCPNCAELIKADAILCRFCECGISSEFFKPCPSCAEMIRIEAKSCRFCGVSELDTSSSAGYKGKLSAPTNQDGEAQRKAQHIVGDVIGQLMRVNNHEQVLQSAIDAVTNSVNANRGLIWQIVGDQMICTNEFSIDGCSLFVGNRLGAQESTTVVLEFLSRFPDAQGTGTISIPDTARETNLHSMSQTLCSLIELGDVRSRLLAQLRSSGVFHGFLEVQQCVNAREWSSSDGIVLQSVSEILALVVQQARDYSNIQSSMERTTIINEISKLCCNPGSLNTETLLRKSAALYADYAGFAKFQIYLHRPEENVLKALIQYGSSDDDDLPLTNNPMALALESGLSRVVNVEFTRGGDEFFNHETAVVVPLISQGEKLGVAAWWKCNRQFQAADKSMAETVANNLALVLRIRKT